MRSKLKTGSFETRFCFAENTSWVKILYHTCVWKPKQDIEKLYLFCDYLNIGEPRSYTYRGRCSFLCEQKLFDYFYFIYACIIDPKWHKSFVECQVIMLLCKFQVQDIHVYWLEWAGKWTRSVEKDTLKSMNWLSTLSVVPGGIW